MVEVGRFWPRSRGRNSSGQGIIICEGSGQGLVLISSLDLVVKKGSREGSGPGRIKEGSSPKR